MHASRTHPTGVARTLAGAIRSLRVATYNIHKGLSQFNRKLMVHELRERLRVMAADLIFLQEVVGLHERHATRYQNWPEAPQYEFLAESVWPEFAYGKNAVYDGGHHGNAILSRFPIVRWENENISAHAVDQRGLLHAEVGIPGWDQRLHCVCVHLGLRAQWRRQQVDALAQRINAMVPDSAPLIIAGDFNDWHGKAGDSLVQGLRLSEAFQLTMGRPARSYPALIPLLRLDRIYVRGLRVNDTQVHRGRPWSRISDHAALTATMTLA